ncbi:MAG TPA: ABC transporter ATP-binding protein [Casimicrobium huifangae]|jgi:lipoprotein-releasing system ATP-binding protein|uniref:ABC transporter ATP-binding protein n=1 Tax=Casimicrobium huifangae TaxID=2591109 RepID=UPI0012EB73AA|nr:ABC transporter ATP-binding protein [Casimicrobium huifangae]HOB03252.1 ABC transporter ATP-binding protein [Casimicrobium huifangae]HQA35118.1 ABC transporter ATP-binding protein [Casimicrobium huifangae]HQD64929.1 ABC transporter ATP-binding protein [Casimicrobium huifangae]
MNNAGDVLRLTAIRKSYNIGTPVEAEILHGINLTVAAGEFTALIGPSGSGKSTLLNTIGLLEAPTSGEVEIAGNLVSYRDDDTLTRLRSQTLGFVFQFHHLLPAFSALENVLMPQVIAGNRITEALRREALQLLESVGLRGAENKKPAELSGGMQQRVAIARALSIRPALVLADEPTGNLDTRTAADIFAMLRTFNRDFGTSFLIVTHDPRLAATCDRRVTLADGQIVADER